MRYKLLHIIRTKPAFLLLLPLFFVWHGYVEFYDLISLSTGLLLILQYVVATSVLLLFFRIFFRNTIKAAQFVFYIMCLYFFFGSLQDFLVNNFQGSFVTKYSFLLPTLVLIFTGLFFYIKKQAFPPVKIIFYLNISLLLFIISDSFLLVTKIKNNQSRVTIEVNATLKPCISCPKPDIYLLLADGYSGKIPLQRYFNYENTEFESQLKKRNFFVVDSSISNYNYTIFSIGSLLNMGYLRTSNYFQGSKDLPLAFKAIKNSYLVDFLLQEQYDVYNHTMFDFNNHPAPVRKTLINFEKSPLTTQTFLYRVNRDISYHLITTFKLNFRNKLKRNSLFDDLENNFQLDSITRKTAATTTTRPKFVYTHLIMPHWPYYFDSLGKKTPTHLLTNTHHSDKKAYVSYLKYTNDQLISLIDFIKSNTSGKAIIILLSDHGFRETEDETYLKKFIHLNLNAVFFPDSNYDGFYKGMSNVNVFRSILNSQFGQHLAMLKDSAINIKY